MTSPFVGTRVNSFSRCCVDVIAERTESRLTRDFMFEAVPYSSASILAAREIWSLGYVSGQYRQNQRYHGRAVAAGRLQALDELFDFPQLDVLVVFGALHFSEFNGWEKIETRYIGDAFTSFKCEIILTIGWGLWARVWRGERQNNRVAVGHRKPVGPI